MKFATKAIHGGLHADEATGAVMTPIYQTSTYLQEGIGKNKGYEYSRSSNPTRSALEKNIATLENGKYGAAFGSGLAAIDCIIKMLNPGDEVLVADDLYGGTYRLFKQIFEKYNISFRFISMQYAEIVEENITSATKLVWIETPTNPTMQIIDIETTAKLTKKHKILLAVDNTFGTPYLQRPLDLGADIIMHSATKYLGGHSDLVLGLLVCKEKDIADEIYRIQNSSGAICGPMDAFLVLRGIKTLHLRMKAHCENASLIAHFLVKHPAVNQVYWPGLKSHPNHNVASKQMDGYGGMISFSLKEDSIENAKTLVENTNIFSLAESLGGVESLIGHPASMTHAAIPKEERIENGIVDSLIRLSVGIEDPQDLLDDLKEALNNLS